MRMRWPIWLLILAVILAAGEGFGWLLRAQGNAELGIGVQWVGRLVTAGWIVFALVRWKEMPWVRRLSFVIITTLVAGLVALLCLGLDARGGLWASVGIYAMGVGFYLGTIAIRAVLSVGWPIAGVARTLIDEAMRMKVPMVFIIAVMLLVPVLPLSTDPAEQLQFRLRSFLSWSIFSTSALLSLMTLFLSVGTVTHEIVRRQIFLTMTKPLGRFQYLAGKWLGVTLLNLLLVAVAGTGIYVFTMVLNNQQALSDQDREAVAQQVLTARRTIKPIGLNPAPPNPPDYGQRFRDRLSELQREDPGTYGEQGTPPSRISNAAYQQVIEQVTSDWLSLGPRQQRTYRFTGLSDLPTDQVQLRIKPQSGSTADGRVHIGVRAGGKPYEHPYLMEGPNLELPIGNYQVLEIPTDRIDADGTLSVTISNPVVNGQPQPTLQFNPTDGFQLLYQSGGFAGNLVRAMGLIWVKLCFISVLGLAAGSQLGFPVASVLCLLIYLTALASGYLAESIASYTVVHSSSTEELLQTPVAIFNLLAAGSVGTAFKVLVSVIGRLFLWLVPSFDYYAPAPLIADGQLISYRRLGSGLLLIGVVWSGLAALVAWLIFRRRELARVTV